MAARSLARSEFITRFPRIYEFLSSESLFFPAGAYRAI